MPPLPAVPNVLRVSLKHTIGADVNAVSRFHLEYAGTAPNDAQCATLAGDIRIAWAAQVKANCASRTTLTETTVEDLTSPSAGIGSDAVAETGTGDGGELPGGLAVVLSALITRRYRGGHPRVYVPYLSAANLSAPQTWDPTLLADLVTAWNAMMTLVLAATWAGGTLASVVNVSYFEGFTNFTYPSGRVKAIPKLRVGGPVVDLVSTWAGNPAPASQRRRNFTP